MVYSSVAIFGLGIYDENLEALNGSVLSFMIEDNTTRHIVTMN